MGFVLIEIVIKKGILYEMTIDFSGVVYKKKKLIQGGAFRARLQCK